MQCSYSDLDVVSSSPSSLYAEDEVLTFKQELAAVSSASPTGSSSSSATLALSSEHQSLLSAADMDDELFGAFVGGAGSAPEAPATGSYLDLYYSAAQTPTGFPSSAVSNGLPPTSNASASSTPARQSGVKRGYERMAADKASPTAAVATSMLAMRAKPQNPVVHTRAAGNTVNIGRRNAPAVAAPAASAVKKEDEANATTPTGTKKTKVSRERQLKINAASRRCRKKQKLELQFLRTHVVELQAALKDQVNYLQGQLSQQQRAARLSHFVDDSMRKVEEMSSSARPSPAATPTAPLVSFSSDLLPFRTEDHSGEDTDGTHSNDTVNHIETDDASSIHTIDPATGYSLSDERKRELLNIASFVRVNISLESSSFAPEVISCLPIEMDGWQLRLAITEKNYTIHNQKFFPCNVKDMFDFCWETNVAQKISIKHAKKHYVVVTPLDKDVAHVYSKTTGKWSLNVHGVPNVSYNSIVCRRYIPEEHRAIICQQSVLEERDFQDESTLPWLFKRWVVFRPQVQDGVEGTFVEAYRTASYATGRLIYKENKTYDSFCEHLIRRYAESNSLLERMMARDKRFTHAFDASVRTEAEAESATVSDRMIKDLLLF
ncbi:Carboxylic acid transporter protein [Phytophthora cinnamomi]|uniref:Carboxylic acid transporter protein n=1 Tax=Phytophthora cinnamomi TaxID=4785 RepID=UPI0035599B49|nr:Carboxylic acid transporter protein [Phytophthora cinnamomi]